jgi:hypothetical protein
VALADEVARGQEGKEEARGDSITARTTAKSKWKSKRLERD